MLRRPGRPTAPFHLIRILAGFVALAVVAAACGGGGGGGGADGEQGARQSEEEAPQEGEPVAGGRLIMGLEADTGSPWTPQSSLCAVSCYMVFRAVYDPLVVMNENAEPAPYLLKSFEPNADFTEWTLTVREGIVFHDGTPLDGEAVRDNLERQRASLLTGKAVKDISGVTANGMTVTVTTSRPWSGFPVYMAGQLGYIASPTWLAAVDAGTAKPTEPVGTGPFVFKSYSPGGSWIGTKNPDYWRTDAKGRQLPYLDEIEFKVLEDIESRSSALKTGDIDIMHTANTDEIISYRENTDFEMIEADQYGETSYILLNVTKPPLDDVNVRRALAMGVNQEEFNQARGQGVNRIANGPYPPDAPGYLEDTGYPSYNPEEARALIDAYEAENGPVEFSFNTTTDDYNRISNELIAQYWEQIGVTVKINQVEQGQYINQAVLGNFDAFAWRNHGNGFDPDTQYIWWSTETALPAGQIALNFGRFQDQVIQDALVTIRTSGDQAERVAAAETINRRFGEQAYNIWLNWTVWAVMFRPEVKGIRSFTTPDGDRPIADVTNGAFQPVSLWVDEG